MIGIPRRYWGIGLSVAVLAHAAIGVVLFRLPAESGARSAGVGGIEISLGPSGGFPGSIADPAAEVAETESLAPEEVVKASRPEHSEAPTPEAVPARSVETAVEASAVPVQKSGNAEAEHASEAPEQVEDSGPETVPTETVETAAERPPERTPEETERRDAQLAKAPAEAGARGKSGTQSGKATGSGTSTTGGGVPGGAADYLATLRAWLEKHERYPRRARRLRQEGTALLYFVINREGEVLEYRIRESSGHEALDEAVAAMIERAQPLPRMPDDMQQGRLELLIPVQFFLL